MFFLVFKRSMVQHARSKMSFVIDNLLIFIASLFLALVYFNNPVFIAPQPTEVRTSCSLCLCVRAALLGSFLSSLLTRADDQAVARV